MHLAGTFGRAARTRAVELVAAVGLSGRIQYKLTTLSGGEQQRAAIAVALANVEQEAVRRGGVDLAQPGVVDTSGPTHEELVVLDQAGRLQIPREVLDRVGLGQRARVEVEGDRIVISKP